MQFSKLILAAAAIVGANAVQFTDPTFAGITAGVPFNITWSQASGPVTITLKNGASTNLQTVATITQGQTGTSFTWTPSTTLPADTYALVISDSSGVDNYSTQFQLVGGVPLSASVSSSLASVSSSVASSVSSVIASITGNSTTSSGSASKTSNSASASGSSSKSSASVASKTSSAASSSSASSTPAPSGNAAAGIASPLAMVFLAFAAII